MFIRVDPTCEIPAVRQIIDGIRVLLVSGRILPGTMLPPVRRLAMELGVHFHTVAEAYRQLATEGWLDLLHGRGARVIDRATPKMQANWFSDFEQRLRNLVAQVRAQGAPTAEDAAELRLLAEELTT